MLTSKRDYEKFFTPLFIARHMVTLLNPQSGDIVLEPSAGNGAIVKAIKDVNLNISVFAVELNGKYEQDLFNAGANFVKICDFLIMDNMFKFTSCCANPPFGNTTDLQAHFDAIRKLVVPNGKIVMILPEDFICNIEHKVHKIDNWSSNNDGSITPIKIVEFQN